MYDDPLFFNGIIVKNLVLHLKKYHISNIVTRMLVC